MFFQFLDVSSFTIYTEIFTMLISCSCCQKHKNLLIHELGQPQVNDSKVAKGDFEYIAQVGPENSNLPKHFISPPRKYENLISGHGKKISFVIQPLWFKKTDSGDYEEVGFKIIDQLQPWSEFIENMLQQPQESSMESISEKINPIEESDHEEIWNEIDEFIANTRSEINSDEADIELHRSSLLEKFKKFYLCKGTDPTQIAESLSKAWAEAERTLSLRQFTNLQKFITTEIEKIIDNEDIEHYRSILLAGFKSLYLHNDNDPTEVAQDLKMIWTCAKQTLSSLKFSYLQQVINNDLEKMVNNQTINH